MKRLLVTSMVCSMLSAGAFGVLLVEDRRLGIPVPYSLPLAFMTMVVIAPALFALFERLRASRPIVIHEVVRPAVEPPVSRPDVPEGTPAPPPRRRAAGVVLLDFSSVKQCREPIA